jgi:hypothetical protein
MSNKSVPELENINEEITDEIIVSESESESESESNESGIMDDEGSFVDDLDIDLDDIDLDDLDLDENDLDENDLDLDDELFQGNNDIFELTELLSSVTTTEEGDTICTALVDISRQLEVQNKIMIKLLSEIQKKA